MGEIGAQDFNQYYYLKCARNCSNRNDAGMGTSGYSLGKLDPIKCAYNSSTCLMNGSNESGLMLPNETSSHFFPGILALETKARDVDYSFLYRNSVSHYRPPCLFPAPVPSRPRPKPRGVLMNPSEPLIKARRIPRQGQGSLPPLSGCLHPARADQAVLAVRAQHPGCPVRQIEIRLELLSADSVYLSTAVLYENGIYPSSACSSECDSKSNDDGVMQPPLWALVFGYPLTSSQSAQEALHRTS
ncbi:hypothetical protein BDW62DRAFT_105791 [Aspergillus aurantiobrunneus]